MNPISQNPAVDKIRNLINRNVAIGTTMRFPVELARGILAASKRAAQEAAKAPIRLATTPVEVVRGIQGKEPLPATKLPVVGEVKSYARQAVDEGGGAVAGLKAFSTGVLDAALLGKLAQTGLSLAQKPKLNVVGGIQKTVTPEQTISRHIAEAKDVMTTKYGKNVPAIVMDRAKNNIVLGLKAEGHIKEAEALKNINTGWVKNLDSLESFMKLSLKRTPSNTTIFTNTASKTPLLSAVTPSIRPRQVIYKNDLIPQRSIPTARKIAKKLQDELLDLFNKTPHQVNNAEILDMAAKLEVRGKDLTRSVLRQAQDMINRYSERLSK